MVDNCTAFSDCWHELFFKSPSPLIFLKEPSLHLLRFADTADYVFMF